MNEFLNSVKTDLLDRRLVPLVALVGVALLAALGYALLGGGSSSPSASVEPSPVSGAAAPLTVSPATAGPTAAVAETTSGAAVQRHGAARDPFALLPGSLPAATTASTSSSSSSSSGSGSSSTSTGTSGAGGNETKSGGTTPTGKAKVKTKTVYTAKLFFGELPAGKTPAEAKLTEYPALSKPTALPNTKEERLEFAGVTVGKNSLGTIYKLTGEVILHGPGVCLPSATQCEVMKLEVGQSEQLEFLPATGPAVTYELRVVGVRIKRVKAVTARRVKAAQAAAAAGLFASGTGALRDSALRYSGATGAFVAGDPAFAGH